MFVVYCWITDHSKGLDITANVLLLTIPWQGIQQCLAEIARPCLMRRQLWCLSQGWKFEVASLTLLVLMLATFLLVQPAVPTQESHHVFSLIHHLDGQHERSSTVAGFHRVKEKEKPRLGTSVISPLLNFVDREIHSWDGYQIPPLTWSSSLSIRGMFASYFCFKLIAYSSTEKLFRNGNSWKARLCYQL